MITSTKQTDSQDLSHQELTQAFGPGLEFDKPLAPLTTFRTGGPARYFYEAGTIDDLASAVKAAAHLGIEFVTIGGGSNLLVSDDGYDGLIIKAAVRQLELVGRTGIACGAGEDLADLVEFAARQSLTGLEFATGIWGTVGGAIYGNAGAYGGQIGSLVIEITVVDRAGQIKTVDRDYCRFSYRDSHFKTSGEIIVAARIDLAEGDHDEIRTRIDEIAATRNEKFPPDGRCAGCFFKNIPDPKEEHGKLAAGRLLEEVGAKSMSFGGARVYEKHANIIVGGEKATSSDIFRLASALKEKVREKFGIILEEEIIQIGRF